MDSRSYTPQTHTHTHSPDMWTLRFSCAAGGCWVPLWGLWKKMVIAV